MTSYITNTIEEATAAQTSSVARSLVEGFTAWDREDDEFGLVVQAMVDEATFEAEYGMTIADTVRHFAAQDGNPVDGEVAMSFMSTVGCYPHTVQCGPYGRARGLDSLLEQAKKDDVTVIGAWHRSTYWTVPQGVELADGQRPSLHPERISGVNVVVVHFDGTMSHVSQDESGHGHEEGHTVSDQAYLGSVPALLWATARGVQRPQCYLCDSEVNLRAYGPVLTDDNSFCGAWTCADDEDGMSCQKRASRFSAEVQDERLRGVFATTDAWMLSKTGTSLNLAGQFDQAQNNQWEGNLPTVSTNTSAEHQRHAERVARAKVKAARRNTGGKKRR